MASFKKMFVTSRTLEIDGVWHDLGAGVKIKVARIGNPEYNAALRKLAQPHKGLARRAVDSDEGLEESDLNVFRDIEARCLAEHVLVDWSGFTETDDVDSDVVEYSVERALKYIKESDDFRKLLTDLASKPNNFKDTVGN